MSRWWYWACVFYLAQSMEAFGILNRLVYGEWPGQPGNKLTQGLNLLLIMTSLALFCRGVLRIKGIRTGSVLFIGAAIFLLLSSFWSIDPETTIRRGVLYLSVVIGAIGFASNMDCDEFMEMLGLTCGIAAVASILLLAVSPQNALTADGTDLRGIFSHKNVLGEVMAAGALASLHAIRAGRQRARNVAMLCLFTVVALVSKSATSAIIIFVFFGIDGVIALLRKGGAASIICIWAIVFLLIPLVVVAALFPDSLLEMIGKDPTLTGRTNLWTYVLIEIAKKPLLGWGFSAFWSPTDPAAVEISDVLKWYVPEAHNGLLEILLNIGFLGAALFVFLWIRNTWLALRCLGTPWKPLAISSLLSSCAISLIAISETVLMEPFQISTTIFFVTGLMCERAMRLAHRHRSSIIPPARRRNLEQVLS